MSDPASKTTPPRGARGRFLPVFCPDPNCDGRTVFEAGSGVFTREHWICDGLTHRRDDDPLVACEREHDAR